MQKYLAGRKDPEARRKYISWAVSEFRRKLKARAVAYLGGKCTKCGYDRCLAALGFHHRDPNEKDFQIGKVTRCWDKIRVELDKCELLCVRCHLELHAEHDEELRLKQEIEVRALVPVRKVR